MPKRHQVPHPLAGRAFARPEAIAVGLNSRQLRAPSYERVASGIWRSAAPSATASRLDARAELLQLAQAQREAMSSAISRPPCSGASDCPDVSRTCGRCT